MTDIVTLEARSRMMSSIKSKHTTPELIVRSCAHGLGLRFRLHCRHLPGKPDLVFPRHKTVVFVHGCFWHHHDCKRATIPKTNDEFWLKKFTENKSRDKEKTAQLENFGWRVIEIWECETKHRETLKQRLQELFCIDSKGAQQEP